jgi:hypothetical protein
VSLLALSASRQHEYGDNGGSMRITFLDTCLYECAVYTAGVGTNVTYATLCVVSQQNVLRYVRPRLLPTTAATGAAPAAGSLPPDTPTQQ